MTESSGTSVEDREIKSRDVVGTLLMGQLAAVATGLNTLLMVFARQGLKEEDLELSSQCMTTVAHIVRVFDGEEAADEVLNHLTEGAYKDMREMMEQGVDPDVAAKTILGEEEDDQSN